jgi:hypothetical protein
VPWLRPLVASLFTQRPLFNPGPVHVTFLVDRVALGQIFLQILPFSPVGFFLPVLIARLSLYMLLLCEGQTDKAWEPSVSSLLS